MEEYDKCILIQENIPRKGRKTSRRDPIVRDNT
jgi:hypothetical protein